MDIALQTVARGADGFDSADYQDLLKRVKKALDSAVDISVLASDIRPYPTQPREYFNEESIKRMAQSIDTGGQMQRGLIREKPAKTRYELIDGERRWRGINLIPIERQPLYKAQLLDADDDVVQFMISGIINFNREPHTPLETMRTIEMYRTFKLPMHQIAALLGISEPWAISIHGLKDLDENVRKLMDPTLPRSQQLPVMAAMQIAKLGKKHQMLLAQRVIAKDISVGRVRGEVVKVAKRTGNTRIRDSSPIQQWRSFENKVGVLTRTATDIEAILKKGHINDTVAYMEKTINDILKALATTKQTIEKIENRINRIRKK